MSSIQVDASNTQEITASLVPMHIQYTGSAKTQDYFAPSKIRPDTTDGNHVAYFRGCKLLGNPIDLSSSQLKGYVINKSEHLARSEDEDGQEVITTVSNYTAEVSFKELMVYGHDVPAESDNQWSLIPEYCKINSILHD
ncbi:uncharacterized protein SPAPADRAFT_48484 [Spathaspora passalidarum NRRL Y-27907]|uniref:Uncharacterized protein n=1 Tax=Spathaspora passalidarum (strain NRRL Y-27907 / 11-Y1) TaxID=619300 RepID=G3AH67_SPAPN|nr:uncharacterized protein SPAPADRAFT_48484 [Spathaspora passalidarum NRRL Y-27907]EGW35497.1 hypothetical protein SPAPADRAFT_48484 [Spathaspora passalidarum NRRL Y-27907]